MRDLRFVEIVTGILILSVFTVGGCALPAQDLSFTELDSIGGNAFCLFYEEGFESGSTLIIRDPIEFALHRDCINASPPEGLGDQDLLGILVRGGGCDFTSEIESVKWDGDKKALFVQIQVHETLFGTALNPFNCLVAYIKLHWIAIDSLPEAVEVQVDLDVQKVYVTPTP